MPDSSCGTCDLANSNFVDTNNFCKQCYQGCKTCNSASPQDCKSCITGYVYNSLTKACDKCHSDCVECKGTAQYECTKCKTGYITSKTQICGICNQNQYNDGIQCNDCPSICSSCTNPNTCTGCISNYFLRGNTCTTSCISTEFIEPPNICRACNPVCTTCKGPNTYDCLSCATNDYYILQDNNLCSPCNTSQGYYTSQNNCLKCSTGCLTCSGGSSNQCNSCISQFYYDSSNHTCSACHADCDECNGTGQNQCQKCKQAGQYLSLQDKICHTCNSNEFNDGIKCNACPQECSSCLDLTKCTSCSSNFYLRKTEQICVSSCNPDEFINNLGECQACNSICKTCKGPLVTDCFLCNDSNKYVQIYQNNSCGTCDTLNGYFINSNKQCEQCTINCLQCSGNGVTDCNVCGTQFYLEQNTSKCTSCNPDCDGCNGGLNSDCKKCKLSGNYLSLQDRTCKPCQSDEYNDSIKCILCPAECSSCTNPNNCTSCSTSYHLRTDNHTCVQQCNSNEFINSQNECQLCNSTCKTCSGPNATDCILCANSEYYVQDYSGNVCGTCNIQGGFFLQNSKCYKCYQNCNVCSGPSSTDCQVCTDQYFLDNLTNLCSTCNPECNGCTGPNNTQCKKCSSIGYYVSYEDNLCKQGCQHGQFNDTAKCLPCLDQCTECTALDQCTACKPDKLFRRNYGQCVSQCNSDEYPSGQECFACNSACKTCTSGNDKDCTSCSTDNFYIQQFNSNICGICDLQNGFYLTDQICNKCILKCKVCSGPLQANCTTCIDGLFLDLNNDCQQCHSDCSTCDGPLNNQCTKCKSSNLFISQSDKTCKTCLSNEYNDTIKCITCPARCTSCTSADSCNSCANGFYFRKNENKCVEFCNSDEFINSNKECQACDSSCKTCTGENPTDCTSCITPNQYVYENDTKLCNTCDTNNGYFISDQKCLKCTQNCLKCSSSLVTDCQKCEGQFYLSSQTQKCTSCDQDCDGCTDGGKSNCKKCKQNGLYLSISNNTCQACQPNEYNDNIKCIACPANCATCNNSSECTSCVDNYFYQKSEFKCVDKCNSNQFVNNLRECQDCNSKCSTCNGELETNCIKCNQDDLYVQVSNSNYCGTCETSNGFFIQDTKCIPCAANCLQCSGPSTTDCQKCEQQFYQDNTNSCLSCHSDCDQCTGPNKNECKKCQQSGLYLALDDNTCKQCNSDEYNDLIKCKACPPSCSACINEQQCTGCKINFYFRKDEGICVDKCHPEEYVSSNNYCLLCDSSCKTCQDKTKFDCLSCSQSGFFVTSDQNLCGTCQSNEYGNLTTNKCEPCHSDCQTCTGGKNTDCNSCIDSTLYACTDKSKCEKSCLKCADWCSSCYGEGAEQCTGCSIGILQSDNTCQKKCPGSQFYNETTNTCDKCIDHCLSCNDSEKCQVCDTSDPLVFMYQNVCFRCTSTQFFSQEQMTCVDCNTGCKTCDNLDTCLSCYEGDFTLDKNCYKICPDGYIGDPKTGECVTCIWKGGECVLVCPQTEFFMFLDICLSCSKDCNQCDGETNCLECKEGNILVTQDKNASCEKCKPNEYILSKTQCKLCIETLPQCLECSLDGKKCLKCIEDYSVKEETGQCVLDFCFDEQDCKQKEFKQKIDTPVKTVNQISGIIQASLTLATFANAPGMWYLSQSYQHIGNYDIYESEFDQYGLGSVYLRSFYKSYNILPNIPLEKDLSEQSNVEKTGTKKLLSSKRMLEKKADLNWDGDRNQTLYNNLIYWSFGFVFILFIFLIMRLLQNKFKMIQNIYIKKGEYITRFILFTSNYMLMQICVGMQTYQFSNSLKLQSIVGLSIIVMFTGAYSFAFYRLFKQSSSIINDQQYSSLFDDSLIKTQKRYKYFWILFEIRKVALVLIMCIPPKFFYSSIGAISLDTIFLIYLFVIKPFSNRFMLRTFIFQEFVQVLFDILMMVCYQFTQYKDQFCLAIVIYLMVLNAVSIIMVLITITRIIINYVKNRSKLTDIKGMQEQVLNDLNDTLDRSTQRSTANFVKKEQQTILNKSSFHKIKNMKFALRNNITYNKQQQKSVDIEMK